MNIAWLVIVFAAIHVNVVPLALSAERCRGRLNVEPDFRTTSSETVQPVRINHNQSRQILQASTRSLATDAPRATPSPAGDASVAQSIGLHPKLQVAAVATVAQFLEAVNTGARYIEIRAHLDLRGLKSVNSSGPVAANPDLDVSTSALVYMRRSIRSLTGDCDSSDVAAHLSLPAEEQAEILPLKPRQCLVIIPNTFLMSYGGRFVMQNLYLKMQSTSKLKGSAFVKALSPDRWRDDPDAEVPALFLVNTTFHGTRRGNAYGVYLAHKHSKLYVRDCIFTDWAGDTSPLGLFVDAIANVEDTVFRNMRLNVELVDVSKGGTVRFQNVQLADVSLHQGKIVSTSINDYENNQEYGFFYTAADDAEYDVEYMPVPMEERGMFNEDFIINNQLISDCMYMKANRSIMPGCPPSSVTRRLEIAMRGGMSLEEWPDLAYTTWDVYTDMLTEEDLLYYLWQVTRPLPPPPRGWAPFNMTPLAPAVPTVRTSITHPLPVPAHTVVPGLRWTPAAATANDRPIKPAVRSPGGKSRTLVGLGAVAALVVVTAAAAVLWVVQTQRWHLEGQRRSNQVDNDRARPPYLRGHESCPSENHAAGSIHVAEPIPRSAMNPEYEYILPAHVARLMAGPTCETNHIATQSIEQARPFYSRVGGRRGSIRGLQLPMLAATQPLDVNSFEMGPSITEDNSGSDPGDPSLLGSRTTPIPAVRRDSNQLVVLETQSDRYGGTSVVAPYTLSSSNTCMLKRNLQDDTVSEACIASAVATYALRTLQLPLPPALPKQHVGEIQSGPAYTAGLRDSFRDGVHERGRRRWRWLRSWLPRLSAATSSRSTMGGEEMADQLMDRLQRQLDRFRCGDLFMGRFEMLGAHSRRRGGQGVVQFAQDVDTMCEYAIKFFLDNESFITEATLYAACFPDAHARVPNDVKARAGALAGLGECDQPQPAVHLSEVAAKFLPQVEAVCDGTAENLVDPQGQPLPPCIVLEKGESLNDWSDRAQPDLFTSLAVLSNISKRLADMHDAGYVHRDLKPGNVMWLPRQNRWTVIDFGCVARAGQAAPLSFTLAYAAPEVVRAFLTKRHYVESTPALDTWSLGVMAFEFLTGAPAFNHIEDGSSRIMQRLRGDLPLPWEGDLSLDIRRRLGSFKGLILQLLHRDPVLRLTMRSFHHACDRLFAERTTVEA